MNFLFEFTDFLRGLSTSIFPFADNIIMVYVYFYLNDGGWEVLKRQLLSKSSQARFCVAGVEPGLQCSIIVVSSGDDVVVAKAQ